MYEGFSVHGEIHGRASVIVKTSLDQGEQLMTAFALLHAEEYEAEAGNDDEESEFKVLTAAEKLVP